MKKVIFLVLVMALVLAMAVPVMADSHECTAPGKAHQSIAKCLGGDVVSSVSPCHQVGGGPGKGVPPQCQP